MSRLITASFVALFLALAVACGGGGSAGGGMAAAPAATSVMSSGAITGFGSIFVNGVHFQTAHAVIRKNGVAVDQSQLAVGEIARVSGTKDSDSTGDADSIDVDENLVGPIDSLDATAGTFTVLGQTVKINAGTSFSADIQPQDINGLEAGQFVHVSGTPDAAGNLVATRIATGAAGDKLQVIGPVSLIDASNHKFQVNALTVDYSGASLEGFAGGQPANGDIVEARGTAYDAATTTLTATQLERMASEHEEAQDERAIEREGLVTRFVSATDFDVAGKPVTTNGSTVFRNGTAADLALNAKVEVEGSFDGSDVLVARVVAFRHNGGIALQAQVTAVDSGAGTLVLLGVTVNVTSSTRVEDQAMDGDHMFNLADVQVGDVVGVTGFESPAGSGALTATRLVRAKPGSATVVAGPHGTATWPQFTVFGITVDASAAQLRGTDGATLTAQEFDLQATGQGVAVTGTLVGTTVQASVARILGHEGGDD